MDVAGDSIVYEHAAATAKSPGSATMVCIHGLAGTRQFWDPILPQLRRRGDVIRVDLPGFGASETPTQAWTLEHAAGSVLALIDRLELERVVLIGHSLGGAVAITAALQDPARVAALTLVSPAGFAGQQIADAAPGSERLHTLWRLAARPLVAPALRVPLVRRTFFTPLVHDPDALEHRAMVALAAGSMRGRSTVAARTEILRTNLLSQLPQLQMPVHLIWGSSDQITPARMAPVLCEHIEDVHLTMLDDVGHLPVWEQPEAVAAAVLSRLP